MHGEPLEDEHQACFGQAVAPPLLEDGGQRRGGRGEVGKLVEEEQETRAGGPYGVGQVSPGSVAFEEVGRLFERAIETVSCLIGRVTWRDSFSSGVRR